ncbi:MAG: HD domain-containing protein [Planctomycetota bacterium]|nr:HD domain-containing protein [Planctomycetota bacterium]
MADSRKDDAKPGSGTSNSPAADSTPDLAHAWQRAISFAARAHKHQLRKDGQTPYVAHVFRVALTVQHVFRCYDERALLAAILHDTIEDTTTDYDDLAESFGAPVADLVAALTKNPALPESKRESEYDARLAGADWRAKLVKLADTYDNLIDAEQLDAPKKKLRSRLEKCQRAIDIAQSDAAAHPELSRAIALLRERMTWTTTSSGITPD